MERGMALYFVAADGSGTLAGDGIVRGAAGEGWMQAQCLHRAATDTGPHNVKLIRLYQKHGYHIVHSNGEMLRLEKCLESYSS